MKAPERGTLDVVWGLGSGRRARALLREGRQVEVLAIDVEADRPDRVRSVVGTCERLRDAEACGRLRVVLGSAADFATRWRELDPTRMDLAIHVDLAALASVPPEARELARIVERLHLERMDLHRFAARMRDNLLANVDALAGAIALDRWTGAAAGRPGFVLAAGPSARAAMPWLAQARLLGPLIAVDTALPLCREFGVAVDCLVSVDPHPGSQVHLQRGVDDVHVLAMQPYCAPAIVEAVSRRVLAVPVGDVLCDRAAAALGLPAVPVAGTVLLYALQVAATLGCDPVIMIGADFAHQGGTTHAQGTATAREVPEYGVFVEDRRGNAVPTSTSLRRFLGDVQRHVASSERRHWAIDGGGAGIAGARAVNPAVIARWVARHGRDRAPQSLPVPLPPTPARSSAQAAVWRRLIEEFDGQ